MPCGKNYTGTEWPSLDTIMQIVYSDPTTAAQLNEHGERLYPSHRPYGCPNSFSKAIILNRLFEKVPNSPFPDNSYSHHQTLLPDEVHQYLFPIWTQADGKKWLLSEPSGVYIVIDRDGEPVEGIHTFEEYKALRDAETKRLEEEEQKASFFKRVLNGVKRRLIWTGNNDLQ
ncbi:hypothetical protein HDU76_002735 [Blyttiomyces sp. JEL0837]|nr:hypothetical protein HDU76_002735 [Blyttiomyces sp. JEL0837]